MQSDAIVTEGITELAIYDALSELFPLSSPDSLTITCRSFSIVARDDRSGLSFCIVPDRLGLGKIHRVRIHYQGDGIDIEQKRRHAVCTIGAIACIFNPAHPNDNLHVVAIPEQPPIYLYSSPSRLPVQMPDELLDRLLQRIDSERYVHHTSREQQ